MTATAVYVIWCNGERCTERVVGDTAWEARDTARVLGWTCGRNMNSRDLCPKHAR